VATFCPKFFFLKCGKNAGKGLLFSFVCRRSTAFLWAGDQFLLFKKFLFGCGWKTLVEKSKKVEKNENLALFSTPAAFCLSTRIKHPVGGINGTKFGKSVQIPTLTNKFSTTVENYVENSL